MSMSTPSFPFTPTHHQCTRAGLKVTVDHHTKPETIDQNPPIREVQKDDSRTGPSPLGLPSPPECIRVACTGTLTHPTSIPPLPRQT